MKINKLIAAGLTTLLIGTAVYAQSKKENETSVESEYMSSIEDVVITEMANSDQRDNKLVALQYLEAAADSGNVSPDMVAALNQLSGEGILKTSMKNVAACDLPTSLLEAEQYHRVLHLHVLFSEIQCTLKKFLSSKQEELLRLHFFRKVCHPYLHL